MLVLIVAALLQGPAAFDIQFQQEEAARTAYAACLFRENDGRRRIDVAHREDFGASCRVERAEIMRLDRLAGKPADVIAAGIQGMEDTLRANITRMNDFYPVNGLSKRR